MPSPTSVFPRYAQVAQVPGERALNPFNSGLGMFFQGATFFGIFFGSVFIVPGILQLFGINANALGFPLAMAGFVAFNVFAGGDPTFIQNGWIRRQSRRVILQRPDRIVEPDEPESMFIKTVPRTRWGEQVVDDAGDVGFLLADVTSSTLFYEGDSQRWIIPRESVISCILDHYPSDKRGMVLNPVVLLSVQTATGVVEFPLVPRGRAPGSKTHIRSRDKNVRVSDLYNVITQTIGTNFAPIAPPTPASPSQAPLPPAAVAQITQVAGAERVLSRRHIIMENLIGFAHLGVFIAGMFLFPVAFMQPRGSAFDALLVVPIAIWVVNLFIIVVDISFFVQKYLFMLMRRVVDVRLDAIVNPDDPEAIFVEVVPRANWNRTMLETAEDIGLLIADTHRRMLVFEGDQERWLIPAESVVSCEVENPTMPVVVIRFHTLEGVIERAFVPRGRGRTRLRSIFRGARARGLYNIVSHAVLPQSPA